MITHPVIAFYLEKLKTPEGFTLNDLWNLKPMMIGNGYFYIPWLFPVDKLSKWNKQLPQFTPEELDFFKNNLEIQEKYLISVERILLYFGIRRQDQTWLVSDKIRERNYWLRKIGHEAKKMSRIIRSLHYCGHPKLAKNLQQIALQLGAEKGYLLEDTLSVWASLLDD